MKVMKQDSFLKSCCLCTVHSETCTCKYHVNKWTRIEVKERKRLFSLAFPKSANSKKKKSLPNSEKKTLESRGNDDIGEDEADQADHLDDDTSHFDLIEQQYLVCITSPQKWTETGSDSIVFADCNLEKDPVELRANNFIHCYRLKRCFGPFSERHHFAVLSSSANPSSPLSVTSPRNTKLESGNRLHGTCDVQL